MYSPEPNLPQWNSKRSVSFPQRILPLQRTQNASDIRNTITSSNTLQPSALHSPTPLTDTNRAAMGFNSQLMATLSNKEPWIAGIIGQAVIKTISVSPPDINAGLETSTLIQGSLLAIIYEASKEVVMGLNL